MTVSTYESGMKSFRTSLLLTSSCWIGTRIGACHFHTSLKLFWSQPMAPWTSAAAYECAAAQSMDSWAVIKKALQECGGDTRSCPGPYPLPEFHIGCRLGRELFSLPVCCPRCPWSHGLRPTSFIILLVWR